jgi:hypothetical protein
MSDYASPAYIAALVLAHLGALWFGAVLWHTLRKRQWAVVPHAAAAAGFLVYVSDFYAVLPALWWPSAGEHAQVALEGLRGLQSVGTWFGLSHQTSCEKNPDWLDGRSGSKEGCGGASAGEKHLVVDSLTQSLRRLRHGPERSHLSGLSKHLGAKRVVPAQSRRAQPSGAARSLCQLKSFLP